MNLIKWIFKGKIIQRRPCEKVSFFFASALLILGYFGYLIHTSQYQYPINYLYIALASVGAGYAGVLYYRISHGKHPYFVFNFWNRY